MKISLFFIKLFLISYLVSSSLNYSIMVGSFIKDSFASNDVRINKAFNLVRDQINGNSSDLSVIPVAVYHQIVNGINYKIIAAQKDNKSKKVDLVQSIVYTGPFSEEFATQTPSITFFEKLPRDLLEFDETKLLQMQLLLNNYLKNLKSSVSKLHSIVCYPDLVYDESFYIVNTDVTTESSTSPKSFIVSLNNEKGLNVIASFDFSK